MEATRLVWAFLTAGVNGGGGVLRCVCTPYIVRMRTPVSVSDGIAVFYIHVHSHMSHVHLRPGPMSIMFTPTPAHVWMFSERFTVCALYSWIMYTRMM